MQLHNKSTSGPLFFYYSHTDLLILHHCTQIVLQFYVLHLHMSTRLSQLWLENMCLCFSTTCTRNCLRSTFFVIVELKFCIKAASCLFSTVIYTDQRYEKSHVVLYDWLSRHSFTERSRKLYLNAAWFGKNF